MASGALRAEHQSGHCQYFLSRPARTGSPDFSAVVNQTLLGDDEKVVIAAANRARNPASSMSFGRRGQDRGEYAKSAERRGMQQNRFLGLLPGPVLAELEQKLEQVPMPLGLVLWEKGEQIRYFYFPIDCVLTLSQETVEGFSTEMAMIGNEGMADILTLLGDEVACGRALVEMPGFAYRLPVSALRKIFEAGGQTQQIFLQYFRALFLQTAQLAACNRFHTIDQQLGRLLLSYMDRSRSNKMITTHERLASLFGVRREGVTEAIGRLKKSGVIEVGRCALTVLDRAALVDKTCECYDAVRVEYDRLRSLSVRSMRPTTAPGLGAGVAISPDLPRAGVRLNGSQRKPGLAP